MYTMRRRFAVILMRLTHCGGYACKSTSLRNFEKEPIDQDILLNSGMFARITDIYVPPEICLVDLF
tara:strand:+ start:578 stop:775 length:198 start_codon:yes stop_codon:yes gene_type:complete